MLWKSLIGKPYELNGNPPHSFDCWQLVRYVRETDFGLTTPVEFSKDFIHYAAVHEAVLNNRDAWTKKDSPCDTDVVVMKLKDRYVHCGLFIDGHILHAMSVKNGGQVFYHRPAVVQKLYTDVEVWNVA